MLGFSTPLMLPMNGDGYKALSLRVPVVVGDAIVVAREWANSTQIRHLVSLLSSRLEILASSTSGLEVLDHSSPLACLDGAEGSRPAGACGL
jgi:hypothetical protein